MTCRLARAAAWAAVWSTALPAAPPIPVKVVVVAMFERGADKGDDAGEFQYWVEREKLDRVFEMPQAYHAVRMNNDGVLGMLTGMGTAKAAASVMAVGMDPRFDFRKAYWLVAGIAGVDPADGSLGSAAWAEWVIDGDLGYEIDAREIPAGWKTGYVPWRKSTPYELPHKNMDLGESYHLDPNLVDWAFQLTRNISLPDTPAMKKERERYDSPNARRAPFVLKGDVLSSSTFWSGKLLDQWANDWVRYHTDGKGNYVTTAMEDTGTLQALTFLAQAGRVDAKRVLVLRTASDFDQPPPGHAAAEGLLVTASHWSGFLPALDSAWRVGHAVVAELVKNWTHYQDALPTSKQGR
ncbi:MAG: purine nucleoside permease [Terriglobia bacterium]|nr:MAG: purine nucleoside permease [Terriglobia bacterium]